MAPGCEQAWVTMAKGNMQMKNTYVSKLRRVEQSVLQDFKER